MANPKLLSKEERIRNLERDNKILANKNAKLESDVAYISMMTGIDLSSKEEESEDNE